MQVHLKPVQSSFLFASMPVAIALGMYAAGAPVSFCLLFMQM